jgi:hypothetical protein
MLLHIFLGAQGRLSAHAFRSLEKSTLGRKKRPKSRLSGGDMQSVGLNFAHFRPYTNNLREVKYR